LAGPGPIYSLSFADSQGNLVRLDSFKGKKILLVNTAIGSSRASQFAGLEQLYQQFKDSLVIIAFPSNDFGHESGADSVIRQAVSSRFGIHYILAGKAAVSGARQHAVFQWLTDSTLNGRASNPVGNDFFKFLIDGSGNWMGVFSDQVDPLSSELINAIKQ